MNPEILDLILIEDYSNNIIRWTNWYQGEKQKGNNTSEIRKKYKEALIINEQKLSELINNLDEVFVTK